MTCSPRADSEAFLSSGEEACVNTGARQGPDLSKGLTHRDQLIYPFPKLSEAPTFPSMTYSAMKQGAFPGII